MKIETYLSGVLEKYVKQSKAGKTEKIDIKENTQENAQQISKGEIDKVEISPQAKLLAELSLDDNAKAQRIAEVKAQIEKGTYKPNLDEIAKSILKEWKGE